MYIRENAGPLAIALGIGVAVGATASFFITRHILNREDDLREEALSTAREVIIKQQSTVSDLQERLAEPKDEVVYITEDEVEEEEDYSDEPVLIDFETWSNTTAQPRCFVFYAGDNQWVDVDRSELLEGDIEDYVGFCLDQVAGGANDPDVNYVHNPGRAEKYELLHNNGTMSEQDEAMLNLPVAPGADHISVFGNLADQVKQHDELPYLITAEEFLENEWGDDEDTLTWYPDDDTLLDSDDTVITDVDRTVGIKNLQFFGYGSSDSNALYVRNEKIDMIYEVVRTRGSFAAEIAGFTEPRRGRNA